MRGLSRLVLLAAATGRVAAEYSVAAWEETKDTELAWWKDWMRKHKDDHLLPRLDPHRPFDAELTAMIMEHYTGQPPLFCASWTWERARQPRWARCCPGTCCRCARATRMRTVT